MGSAPNLPAAYVLQLLTGHAEIALLASALVVAVLARTARFARRPAGLRAAEGPEPPARRILRMGIGVLWILDGLLQAQPEMARQFASMVVQPALVGQPGWLVDAGDLGIRIWSLHPVAVDGFSVLFQIALGAAIVVGGRGAAARAGLWISIPWALAVWVLGEAMGGVAGTGATALAGAPGAALFYAAAAAVVLAVPDRAWLDGRAARVALRCLGAFWLAAAALQALPAEGFWGSPRLAALFGEGASASQPWALGRPLSALAHLAGAHPSQLNAAVVAVMALVGAGLATGRAPRAWLWTMAGWLALVWWFGMDFGVLGGVGTDPNAAVPLALFAAAALAGFRGAPAGSARAGAEQVGGGRGLAPEQAEVLGAGTVLRRWIVLGTATAALWAAVPALASVPAAARTPSAQTAALADSGGVVQVQGAPLVAQVGLVDQQGRSASLAEWHGRVVLVCLFDPAPGDAASGVVARELAATDRLLAGVAGQVEVVAVDTGTEGRGPAYLGAFDAAHGLATLANFRFLTGTSAARLSVASLGGAGGAPGQMPEGAPGGSAAGTGGMAPRAATLAVVDPGGRVVALTWSTGRPGAALESSYAQMLAGDVRRYLPGR